MHGKAIGSAQCHQTVGCLFRKKNLRHHREGPPIESEREKKQ